MVRATNPAATRCTPRRLVSTSSRTKRRGSCRPCPHPWSWPDGCCSGARSKWCFGSDGFRQRALHTTPRTSAIPLVFLRPPLSSCLRYKMGVALSPLSHGSLTWGAHPRRSRLRVPGREKCVVEVCLLFAGTRHRKDLSVERSLSVHASKVGIDQRARGDTPDSHS